MMPPETEPTSTRAATIALARQHLLAAEELLTEAAEDGALSATQCLNAGRGIQTAIEATNVQQVVSEPKPGDLCRILDDGSIEHHGCDQFADGVVTKAGRRVGA